MNLNAIRASYSLWMKIRCLHNTIAYAECIYDFNNSDENDKALITFLDLITSKIEKIFDNLIDGDVFFALFDQNLNESTINQEEIWENFETLLDNLSKLFMAKDYNIITDFDGFFNNLNEILSFFEKRLKTFLLSELCKFQQRL